MKQARKTRLLAVVSVLFAASLFCVSLAGCEKPQEHEIGEISDYDSEVLFPVGTPGDDASSGETVSKSGEGTQNSGFVVRDKKYDYEGNNLMILNVENQTDTNYAITINGVYLDENGETLKEETVTFEGFAAGWKNNFFFVPGISFDRFAYTLETTEYDGDCLAQLFTPIYKFDEGYDYIDSERMQMVKTIAVRYGFDYEQIPQTLVVYVRMLVLTNQGNVYAYLDYSDKGASAWAPDRLSNDEFDRMPALKSFYTFPDQNNKIWPEELTGDAKVLFSITGVEVPYIPDPVWP